MPARVNCFRFMDVSAVRVPGEDDDDDDEISMFAALLHVVK